MAAWSWAAVLHFDAGADSEAARLTRLATDRAGSSARRRQGDSDGRWLVSDHRVTAAVPERIGDIPYGVGLDGGPKIGSMGIYQDHVLPRFQDKVMGRKPNRAIRARICDGLEGSVVEIGFGTGLNTRYYPSAVTRVVAIEPSRVCMRIAEPRIASSSAPVEYGGLTGEVLDLPSGEFDAALSTWTLCTIPNMGAALGEIRRVLKPGGSFHFVEHGHAPDQKVARWQRRLEPMNKRLAGGCHLSRHISEEIERAGFEIDDLDSYYLTGEPKPMGYTYEGRATSR